MPYTTQADLGGLLNQGAVQAEPEGELWHAAWEPRAMALTVAMGATGAWNIDQSRAARETLPDYRQRSYYQVWIGGLQKLLAERSLIGPAELAAGHAQVPGPALPRKLAAADVAPAIARGSPTARPATQPARFEPGDRVITEPLQRDHHSRVPAYARGKAGVVRHLHGCHVFAEAHAQGLGEQAQWLYTVEFDGGTLWGEDSDPLLRVSIDAWESTLRPLEGEAAKTQEPTA
jgi:nitrile hydratase